MKKGTLYKLDNEYLRCMKIYKNGIHVFQVADSKGNVLPAVRNRDGYILDHGTRLVFNRINELIEV